ncbi:hypothetical protein PUN28_016627 [Cardiocondyla obscurior]|uniref:Uncharacterized protein n=1 Tax=Cardiocondyla obscurior TaxID=286306 RepID=A0AAW2ETC5_9HYME
MQRPRAPSKLKVRKPQKYDEIRVRNRENTKTAIQFYELPSGILTARLYETERKVFQECSHSFRLTLSRPNSSVKAYKHFTFGKVGTFTQQGKFSPSLPLDITWERARNQRAIRIIANNKGRGRKIPELPVAFLLCDRPLRDIKYER